MSRFIQNPYWSDFVTKACNGEAKRLRQELVCRYALAVTSPQALKAISRFVPVEGIVEIGAGTGYWQHCLTQMGLAVIAFDNCPVDSGGNQYFTRPTQLWSQVLRGESSIVANYPTRALMLCWPPNHTPMASTALNLYEGNYVIYIGEPSGKRTGDRAFHNRLARHWKLIQEVDIPRWSTHDDWLFLYRRK